jgi:hypothetical protein
LIRASPRKAPTWRNGAKSGWSMISGNRRR